MSRKVVLYIAMSVDGYIAKPDNNLDFLSIVEKEGEDYGYVDFVNSIDTVIMGRKTYSWLMTQVPEFPHTDKQTYIITRTPQPAIDDLQFYTGDLKTLINSLKSKKGKDIFCDGGAEIVHEFLKHDLIDELIISVIPIMVGNGTKLFKDDRPELKLTFITSKQFEKGLVQLYYKRERN